MKIELSIKRYLGLAAPWPKVIKGSNRNSWCGEDKQLLHNLWDSQLHHRNLESPNSAAGSTPPSLYTIVRSRVSLKSSCLFPLCLAQCENILKC